MKNRIHCDKYLIIGFNGQKLSKFTKNFGHLYRLYFNDNSAFLETLSHSYGKENERIWKLNAVLDTNNNGTIKSKQLKTWPKVSVIFFLQLQ